MSETARDAKSFMLPIPLSRPRTSFSQPPRVPNEPAINLSAFFIKLPNHFNGIPKILISSLKIGLSISPIALSIRLMKAPILDNTLPIADSILLTTDFTLFISLLIVLPSSPNPKESNIESGLPVPSSTNYL